MKHLKQAEVAERLGMDAKKIMRDRIENPAAQMIRDLWTSTKDDIAAFARGVWSQENAEQGLHLAEPARHRIQQHVDRAMQVFRDEVVHIMKTAGRQAFELQYLLDHWILDQVTPPNVKVRPKRDATLLAGLPRMQERPAGSKVKESGGHHHVGESWFTDPVEGAAPTGEDSSAEQRVDGWSKAWTQAAITGIMLGGVQGDSPEDIEGRIDSATAGGSQLDSVLDRLIRTQVQVSIANADDEFSDDYSDMIEDRIWVTMDDERVCEDCESQEGLPEDEWTFDQPAHPRCRCWARLVPKGFQGLAGGAAVPGVSDDSMAIRDPESGEVVGSVTVEFSGWSQGL